MVLSIVEGSVQMLGSVSGTDQTAIGINADANRAQRFFVENPLAIIQTATGIAEFIGAGEVVVTQEGSAVIVSGTPHSAVGGVTYLNTLHGALTISGADGVGVTTQDPTITVSGFHDEFVAVSGLLQDAIDGIGPGSISDAMLGVDGVTVISGTPTESQTTVSGFRDEFVSASGSLQAQIAGPISSNQKIFAAPTTYFPFTHGLNSTEVEVSFYVDEPGIGERQVGLDEIYVIDANTISGSATIPRAGRLVVVAGGAGGSSAATLQSAYDAGDGTITTTALKPLELQGSGELLAVTGTFTGGLTVGTGTLHLTGDEVIFNGDSPVRLAVDSETSFLRIEKNVEGLWQPSSLEVSANTLWVGKNVGLGGIGHHLVTETMDNHSHFHAHSNFYEGLSVKDTQVVNVYSYTERLVFQPDDSGNWAGTTYEFVSPSEDHVLIGKGYLQTHTTAATQPVRIRTWVGTDDTGTLIFDQTYPASNFPADSEITIDYAGYLEFEAGNYYFTRYSSSAAFSLKTNASVTFPWVAADYSLAREENLLQTKGYVSGEDFDKGDLLIDDRQIYVCLTSGTQSGTLADNADKWNNLEYMAVSGTDTQDLVTVSGHLQSEIDSVDSFYNRTLKTGIISGGALSVATTSTINVASGTGIVIDATDASNITRSDVSWDEVLGYAPNLSLDGSSIILADSAGNISDMRNVDKTDETFRDYIIIGTISIFMGMVIFADSRPENLGYDAQSFQDFVRDIIGTSTISGLIYSANGASLALKYTSGRIYDIGSGFAIGEQNTPNEKDISGATAPVLFMTYHDGPTLYPDGAPSIYVNPNKIDNGDGTTSPVGNNNWTVQRIFYSPTATLVSYGQEEYNTYDSALDAFNTQDFFEAGALPSSWFRAYVIIKEGATDLSDTTQAVFFAAPKFRLFGVGGAGGGVSAHPSLLKLEWDVAGHLFEDAGVFDIGDYDLVTGSGSVTFGAPVEVVGSGTFTGDITANSGTFTLRPDVSGDSIVTRSDISTHAAISTAHHTKYTDGEAVSALETITNALATSGTTNAAAAAANTTLVTTTSGHLQNEIDSVDSSVTLQEAYDNGNGTIALEGGKPVSIDGGNVGIGTATPIEPLTVDVGANTYGGIEITNSDSGGYAQTGLILRTVHDLTTKFGSYGTHGWHLTARSDTYSDSDQRKDLRLEYRDGPVWTSYVAFFEHDTGNIGFGTDTPTERLDVVGSGTFTGDLAASFATFDGLVVNGDVTVGPTGDITLDDNGEIRFAGGASRIYSPSDADPLIISESQGNGVYITEATSTNYLARFLYGGGVWLYYNRDEKLETTPGGVEVTGDLDLTGDLDVGANVTVSGAVGIGTSAPAHNLHVVGSGTFTGDVLAVSGTFTGDISAGGDVEITNDLTVGNDITLSTTQSKIHESDGNGYLEFGPNGRLVWVDLYNNEQRLTINALASYLNSPSGWTHIAIHDDKVRIQSETHAYLDISTESSSHDCGVRFTEAAVDRWVFYSSDNGNFYFNENTSDTRMTIEAGGNVGIGADPLAKLDVNGDLLVRTDTAVSGNLTVGNDIFFSGTMAINDGTRNRLGLYTNSSTLVSADGTGSCVVENNGVYAQVGGVTRLYLYPTESILASPDETNTLTISDGDITLTSGTITGNLSLGDDIFFSGTMAINDGTRNRLGLYTTTSTLLSPNGLSSCLVGNDGFYAQVGGTSRILIDSTTITLDSPTMLSSLKVSDPEVTVTDGTRDRIVVSGTDTRLVSPDGAKSLSVNDTRIDITGNLSTDGYIASSGKLQSSSTADGETLLQFETTRRWAFQQEGTSTSASLRLRNLNGMNKNFHIDTNGEVNFRSHDGAITYLTHQVGALTVRDANRIRFRTNSSEVRLASPDGANRLIVNNTETEVTGNLDVVGSGTYTGDLTINGTTVNLPNLPTASGALSPGDLWVDVSADHTLKVTP